MDMAISAAPVSSQPKATTTASETNATASASGSGDFKQTLTSSMKEQGGASATASKAEASGASKPAAETVASGEASGAELLTADQVIEAIGQLLQALQSEDLSGNADQTDAADQLKDMLDQLNAMLALLGGQMVEPLPLTPGREAVDMSADVQQALVQLQETIGRGQLGAAQLGNSQQWLGSQLKGLKQAFGQLQASMQAASNAAQQADSVQAAPAANGSTKPVVNVQQAEPVQAKATVLLDQLNRQSVSPQLLQLIAAQGSSEEDTDGSDTTATASEDFANVLNMQTSQLTDAARSASAVRQVNVAAPVPAQQFAETMANLMVGKFEVKTAAGLSEARLTLTPEHLGQVDVRISVHNGQLTALFVAESSSAKDLLDNQLAQLRTNLQSQGLNVEKLEVTQQSVESQMSHQHREGSGRQQSEDGVRIGDQAESDEAAFEAELAQQSVIRDLGYGRSINFKA
ncbi:flagellar hook-length control protein FliK [Paenibacillus kobensis]|uniref:flagellar hook-length control protein FliK n=1 Tax=Paenibacillus kobensis TaxID=59841 RepID=UPI000FDA71C6|nr:flagellar hook-length control protein FliK [Paenibacillus kobensis]